MPCRDDRRRSDDILAQGKIDTLTQNLCFLCGQIEGAGAWNQFGNPRIEIWWRQHLEDDNKRIVAKMQDMIKRNTSWTAGNLALILIREAEKVHPVSEWHKEWFEAHAEQEVKRAEADRVGKKQLQSSIAKKLSPGEMEFLKNGGNVVRQS